LAQISNAIIFYVFDEGFVVYDTLALWHR